MARGGARPGAGRKAGKSANTSPLSRARAREVAGNQRPWPADKVERWAIDRLIAREAARKIKGRGLPTRSSGGRLTGCSEACREELQRFGKL